MKRNLLTGALVLVAGSLLAADSAKDELTAAAKKLGDNYSWTTTMDMGANAQFTPGPTDGKTADGIIWTSSSFGDNTSEGAVKGTNVIVKTENGWQTAAELSSGDDGGGFNPSRFMIMRVQNTKAPATEIADLVDKAKEITKADNVYSADLTDDGVKALSTMGFGRRRGGGQGGPQITDGKGSLKFWVKDGAITKYQFKVSGKMPNRDGDVMDFERTTTTEIKDVGATKLTIPDDAKKKLS